MLYTEHFEVSSHDTDPNNIARASSVLRYMQETANHQMRDQKPSYSELFEQGMAFVLSRIRMSLYHPLHQYDKIDVQSWPCESRGASFNRCYRIYKDGLIIAEAASIWALVGTKDRKLYRNNDVDFSNYSFGEPVELDLPGRFHIPQEVNLSLVGERTIEYGDIDCNRANIR